MRVLYFAWLRSHIGASEETIALPEGVATVGQLMSWLGARSAGHAEAFANPERIRAAVNQTFADFDAAVGDGDEIAFFPPVTGG